MVSGKSSKKSRTGLIISLALLLGLVIVLIVFLIRKIKKNQPVTIPETANDAIKFYFLCWGISSNELLCKLMTAIAAHETGNFKSDIYIKNHNAFGMKMPTKRKTIAVKELNGYAYYNSIEDSIRDWLLWWEYHNIDPGSFKNVTEIVNAMKEKQYFEASLTGYRKAVQGHFNVLDPQIEGYIKQTINKAPLFPGKIE